MTDDMMTLRALLEKSSDADLLREMIGFAAQRLMELEVEGLTGAGARRAQRRSDQPAQRLPRPGLGDPRRHGRAAHPEAAGRAATSPASWSRAGWPRRRSTAVIQEAYVQGVSTRSVDDLVQAMGMTGISKSQVSRLCGEIDDKVAGLPRPAARRRLALCLARRDLREGRAETGASSRSR